MRFHFHCFVVAALLVVCAAPGAAQDRQESTERIARTFRIGDSGRLTLSNIAGDIAVTGGGGEEVSIEAVKRTRGDRSELATIEIRFDERPGRLEVSTRHTSRERRGDRASVDFTVTVPRNASVDLTSVSGGIRVTGVRGSVRAQSVSGTVRTVDSPRVEAAKSVSGNVEVESTSGDSALQASTVSGTVRLRDVKARSIAAGSVSGGVEATNVEAERVELKTVSGDVVFTGSPARNGRYEFNSHSGDVQLNLSGGSGFEFTANTFSGSIRSNLPSTVENTRRTRGRRAQSIRGVVGDGGARLSATTFSGDIAIETR